MKATKEEYLKNLQEMAKQREEELKQRLMMEEDSTSAEEQEFEELARETMQQDSEEFGEIIKIE
jgi:hypothetical protein